MWCFLGSAEHSTHLFARRGNGTPYSLTPQQDLFPTNAAQKASFLCKRNKAAEREHAGGAGTLATPAVRRIAREYGLDLAIVHGTGPGGRVLKGALHRPGLSLACNNI